MFLIEVSNMDYFIMRRSSFQPRPESVIYVYIFVIIRIG